MSRIVTAVVGDTLCRIARANGYPHCQRLRDDAANATFRTRDLRAGDRVTVPAMTIIERARGVTDRHVFRRPGVPLPGLRVTHGLADATDPATEGELRHLNISNFRADMSGANGQANFFTGNGFDADNDQDPDTFKVEVQGVVAGTANVNVTVEAMKPVYTPGAAAPTSWVPFAGADPESARRSIIVMCSRMTNWPLMQSAYLRLVVDEADFDWLSGSPKLTDGTAQALYVSDMADGNNGAADRVEILDQQVRVSYEVHNCPAPAGQKCTIRKCLPVGPRRQRLKVAFHVYRDTVGGAAIAGITEQMIRRRVYKWFRRLYAPAEIAPKILTLEFLDPPGRNMLVISNVSGRRSSGVNAAGTVSHIELQLAAVPPAGGWPGGGRGPAPTPLRVRLARNLTPRQVGDRIAAALPAAYQAQVFDNATCIGQPRGSCDVLITRTDGNRCTIRRATTDDTTLRRARRLRVPTVNLTAVADPAEFNEMPALNIESRRLVRESPGTASQLDYYIIGTFVANGIGAYAMLPFTDFPVANQPLEPMPRTVIIAAQSGGGNNMDLSDQFFSMLPHEGGHALMDVFHTDNADLNYTSSIMYDFENSVDAPDVDKRKRVYDNPVMVTMWMAQVGAAAATSQAISMTDRLRTRSAPCLEAW